MNVYDLVGVGFGPANLALAITADEQTTGASWRPEVVFFDERASFAWHPGMLFDTSELQVSFLKDLATMRNPRSKYTFLNYLYEDDRLHDFINLRTFYPPRIDFDRYYRWAARDFSERVHYGHRVVSITPEEDRGRISLLRLTIEDVIDHRFHDVLARNVTRVVDTAQ